MKMPKKYSPKWWKLWRSGAFPLDVILFEVAKERANSFSGPALNGRVRKDTITWASQKLQMSRVWGFDKTDKVIEEVLCRAISEWRF